MCATSNRISPWWKSNIFLYPLMMLLGLLSGYSDIAWLQETGLFISDVFIRIFKCISLPIITLSIVVTLANYRADGVLKHLWRRAIFYTFGTTFVAALLSAILYMLIHPSMADKLLPMTKDALSIQSQDFDYFKHISQLIPTSLLSPFIEQQVFSALLISIVFGIAIRFIPDTDARMTVTHMFRGLHGLLMVITRWVIAFIPLAMYGFITATIVQFKSGMVIKGVGEYLLVVVLANLIQGFVVLPAWLKSRGIQPYKTMRAMLPALNMAFFSKSSVGTLPLTIDTAEKNLRIKPEISRFVLPLCTSLNMNGCAAFIFTTVVYLMQNHGVDIGFGSMMLWVVIATLAAIGNAGVPMGCFFLSASLLASLNVPITLLGIILPFYSVIDMLETSLNVWSDSCVAVVVDKEAAGLEEELSLSGLERDKI